MKQMSTKQETSEDKKAREAAEIAAAAGNKTATMDDVMKRLGEMESTVKTIATETLKKADVDNMVTNAIAKALAMQLVTPLAAATELKTTQRESGVQNDTKDTGTKPPTDKLKQQWAEEDASRNSGESDPLR